MSLGARIFIMMCRKSDKKRDKGLTVPPGVETQCGISYGSFGKWGLLDVYRPKSVEGKLPVIVSFHGGGWVYGDKEVYRYYCMELAKRGFAVVNYNYRLAPKYRHPAPLEDTNAVFSWIMENKDSCGFDTDNIFAVGDSAGATGIALYACILTSPSYAANYSFKPPAGLKIKGLALNCGIYDNEKRFGGAKRLDFVSKESFKKSLSEMTVCKHITEDFPPCFVMTANADDLSAESPPFVKILGEKGVRHIYREYGTDDHRLYHVFHCDARSEDAARVNDDECSFFRELMG